ncbi:MULTISPECIES: 50S ribosomal protein L25/general stress protein Ctc [Neobacillus]|jgi:large subunit ribosomal protein L25|uniref:Large ribosomal subunit protein bL25 n=1 Tax=Neobacillus sedimentimangrovi TaxID=2699460 RepID=A0ABS8QKD3_9BACI|nr:50S ribosomal protein L25/general stress protein Ctc [Neobacillus sedimentimangrovi]AIM16609.1 50S ribosomal protein L25 [Bacillus sp. X1(2014)]MCD4839700.1 50S ribosomal protein L25/general stress protein Ctc [Neobacillus sedimentimangrovi]
MSAVLQAKERKDLRRSELKKIRETGNIPAIVYGAKVESKPVFVSSADFTKAIKAVGRNGIISLDVDGNKQDVILSDYQEDMIKREIIHVDFLAVDKSSKITVDVKLALVGDAIGVKDGGVLQQPLHQISVTTTPDNIPPQIEVDISNLQVGETLYVRDIPTMGMTINHEESEVVASILPPKVEEEINAGEQQEGGHPDNEEGRETEPVGKE